MARLAAPSLTAQINACTTRVIVPALLEFLYEWMPLHLIHYYRSTNLSKWALQSERLSLNLPCGSEMKMTSSLSLHACTSIVLYTYSVHVCTTWYVYNTSDDNYYLWLRLSIYSSTQPTCTVWGTPLGDRIEESTDILYFALCMAYMLRGVSVVWRMAELRPLKRLGVCADGVQVGGGG